MKQYEQVIQVMKEQGGFATLGYLNQKVDVSKWESKTPFASIRRIVQDSRFFFKIRPGLWALNEYREQVLGKFDLQNAPQKEVEFTHSYYQGLLLEIGSLKGFNTYIPPQDKNKMFLDRKLGAVSTIDKIYDFTFPKILERASTVDVIWFNERNLPNAFFEVEHSTDIKNSLVKYNDLQDFYSKFYILGAPEKRRDFEKKITFSSFKDIKERVKFIDYEFISKLHTKSFELSIIGDL